MTTPDIQQERDQGNDILYVLLETDDDIRAYDEYYDVCSDSWLPVPDSYVNDMFDGDVHNPIRRPVMSMATKITIEVDGVISTLQPKIPRHLEKKLDSKKIKAWLAKYSERADVRRAAQSHGITGIDYGSPAISPLPGGKWEIVDKTYICTTLNNKQLELYCVSPQSPDQCSAASLARAVVALPEMISALLAVVRCGIGEVTIPEATTRLVHQALFKTTGHNFESCASEDDANS